MMLYMMSDHKDKPDVVELADKITYDGSLWYPVRNTEESRQSQLLNTVWKVLTGVGGFTRGDEFDDDDIMEMINE
jgi:hypothetical protein